MTPQQVLALLALIADKEIAVQQLAATVQALQERITELEAVVDSDRSPQ